jgi:hypothetical protein
MQCMYLFLNFFIIIIWLLFVQASPLRHLIKSCLCVVLFEAPENAQSHVSYQILCVDASLATSRTNAAVHSVDR